jgi:hypothetical protein
MAEGWTQRSGTDLRFLEWIQKTLRAEVGNLEKPTPQPDAFHRQTSFRKGLGWSVLLIY